MKQSKIVASQVDLTNIPDAVKFAGAIAQIQAAFEELNSTTAAMDIRYGARSQG
jgi:hypothetical protein